MSDNQLKSARNNSAKQRIDNRKEMPVKNNPGIYKLCTFDEKSQKLKDTGKYRAIRRIKEGTCFKKEQAVFLSLKEAKDFRMGVLDKGSSGFQVHKNTKTDDRLTFAALIEEWKPFHFLTVRRSTQQLYDKMLPHLKFLNSQAVDDITASVVDGLIQFWASAEYQKNEQRESFERELRLLRTILNFYRERKNPSYPVPILGSHFEACNLAKKAKKPVEVLTEAQLISFLEDFKKGNTPQYYYVALTQYCLSLRVSEVCGLKWDFLDLPNRTARIEEIIVWDYWTWEPKPAPPKNGKVRILVIPEILAIELEKLKATRDRSVPLVFHKNGHPLSRKTLLAAYNRVLDRLGIKHLSGTHILRKASATHANEATGDIHGVQTQLDHSSPNITLRYVAATTAKKQKVACALNEVLKGTLSDTQGPLPPMAHAVGETSPQMTSQGSAVPQCPTQREKPRLYVVK